MSSLLPLRPRLLRAVVGFLAAVGLLCGGLVAWRVLRPPLVETAHALPLAAVTALVGPVRPEPGLRHETWPLAGTPGVGSCAACHDHGEVVRGKRTGETAEEWRRTPAAAGGRACTSCHHAALARSDWAAAFHAGVKISISPSGGAVGQVKLTATDQIGHRLPTTLGVELRVSLAQVDRQGLVIEGTTIEGVVGRRLDESGGDEQFDTRLFPGEVYKLRYEALVNDECVSMIARVVAHPGGGRDPVSVWEERVVLLPA
ncbi:MAG: hypothetical protein EXR71_10200 [Myxococcales bacterium]|nr:hypothetical protein [Myxococcales bacterium]